MNAPGLASHRPPQEADEIQQLLDSLANGRCSTDDFIREVLVLEKHDPDLPWEVITLLDECFHRDRISHAVFVSLKARLEKHLLDAVNPIGKDEPAGQVTIRTTAAAPLPESPAVERRAHTVRAGDMLRGRYRVTDVVLRSSSGALVEAMDEHRADIPDVRQRVAIQLFDAEHSQDRELLQRIYSLQELAHPCIRRVYDLDEDESGLFVTMEWLSGVSLQQLIDMNGGARLALPAAQTILRCVADALAYAHWRDVFHGDVRSTNVVITDKGEARLRGFEMVGKGRLASATADRLAFAQLAYSLLSGRHAPDYRYGRGACKAALRQPKGVTSGQWQAMRDVLLGEDRPGLFQQFTCEDAAPLGHSMLLQAFAPVPAKQRSTPWLAAASVVAVLGVAYILNSESDVWAFGEKPPTAAPAAPAVTPQPVAAAPAATPVATKVAMVSEPPRRVMRIEPEYSRIELEASLVPVPGDEPFARVWVKRGERMSGPVTFRWWTETGTARLNTDFLGITPRIESIPEGVDGIELRVPLLPDAARDQPRNFYVKIDSPGGLARMGVRTLTQVSILPRPLGDTSAPAAGLGQVTAGSVSPNTFAGQPLPQRP